MEEDVKVFCTTEEVVQITRKDAAAMLDAEPFGVVDARSAMFQLRYAQTDGGIVESPMYQYFRLIRFAGQERIECMDREGNTIKLFADGPSFEVRPS